ncbi:hypothetical protein [Shewanella sp.]|uniref:hypothetical protein n=1 Tax=Shewanella sp. TaxID=50422 RepID=UPI001EC72895|nr:hypothetical protein [Shewanella sp.]NRB23215.1 hypothetical protein [Shewanella sp.]
MIQYRCFKQVLISILFERLSVITLVQASTEAASIDTGVRHSLFIFRLWSREEPVYHLSLTAELTGISGKRVLLEGTSKIANEAKRSRSINKLWLDGEYCTSTTTSSTG